MHPTRHHTEYAPPVLRAPSPASSIGTTYEDYLLPITTVLAVELQDTLFR